MPPLPAQTKLPILPQEKATLELVPQEFLCAKSGNREPLDPQLAMARAGRYLPMMKRIFKEHGLPQDLIYIALVESGFSPCARSPKNAVGIWQFIEGTARRYGLEVND